MITFGSESDGEPWALGEILLHSEQSVLGHDQPITVMGALSASTVAELVEHVSQFWAASGAGPMAIAGVSSNALPPLRLMPEYLQGKTSKVLYVVSVSSLEPTKPYVHAGTGSANFTIASSSSNSVFSIWLRRDKQDQLEITDVYASGFPVTNPERLVMLRNDIERPSDRSAEQSRLQAAVAVVPDAIRRVLERHPSIEHSDEPIEISTISPDAGGWKALLRRDMTIYRVSFRYDGKLDILSVEQER